MSAITNYSILLKNYLGLYRCFKGLNDISTRELVSIWQKFLGRINSITVEALRKEMYADERKRAEVVEFIQRARIKEMMEIEQGDNQEQEDDSPLESQMDFVNQELMNKYQTENTKTIIISNSQYERLFEQKH